MPFFRAFNSSSRADPPQSVNGISSHEEEEISELQDDDRELFSDQLSSIGMLGRVASDHCIPLLTRSDVTKSTQNFFYPSVILSETAGVFPVPAVALM